MARFWSIQIVLNMINILYLQSLKFSLALFIYSQFIIISVYKVTEFSAISVSRELFVKWFLYLLMYTLEGVSSVANFIIAYEESQ